MDKRSGLNQIHVKNENRGLVLRMLAAERLSRADITKRIGLTKMTVSNITAELIAGGISRNGKLPKMQW